MFTASHFRLRCGLLRWLRSFPVTHHLGSRDPAHSSFYARHIVDSLCYTTHGQEHEVFGRRGPVEACHLQKTPLGASVGGGWSCNRQCVSCCGCQVLFFLLGPGGLRGWCPRVVCSTTVISAVSAGFPTINGCVTRAKGPVRGRETQAVEITRRGGCVIVVMHPISCPVSFVRCVEKSREH